MSTKPYKPYGAGVGETLYKPVLKPKPYEKWRPRPETRPKKKSR